MIAYASQTSTRKNLAELKKHDWRLLISPTAKGFSGWNTHGFRYCLDNGAWHAHNQNKPFDEALFRECVETLGAGADFILLPDVVGGGWFSYRCSRSWIDELKEVGVLLVFPAQDDMTPESIDEVCSEHGLGFAIGGSTPWKESVLCDEAWAQLAERHYCHVLRVNTRRRIRLCRDFGADSFDGSRVSRFSMDVDFLSRERDRGSMWREPGDGRAPEELKEGR